MGDYRYNVHTWSYVRSRVYNKEGAGRESVLLESVVPCTAVVRVQARLIIFIMCAAIYGVIVGSRIRVARNALPKLRKL